MKPRIRRPGAGRPRLDGTRPTDGDRATVKVEVLMTPDMRDWLKFEADRLSTYRKQEVTISELIREAIADRRNVLNFQVRSQKETIDFSPTPAESPICRTCGNTAMYSSTESQWYCATCEARRFTEHYQTQGLEIRRVEWKNSAHLNALKPGSDSAIRSLPI